MKKGNLIIGLATVALLASCNKTTGDVCGLTRCNEVTAISTASLIDYEQDSKQDERLVTEYEDSNLYEIIPTSITKFKTSVDFLNHQKMTMYGMTAESREVIHKECNLDLDKMCYTCTYRRESSGTSGELSIDTSKLITFFKLNEKQAEDVTDAERTGVIYRLYEFDGAKRQDYPLIYTSGDTEYTYADWLGELHDLLFGDNINFDRDYAWGEEYSISTPVYYSESDRDIIFQKYTLNNFYNMAINLKQYHDMALELDDENNYLNYKFGSNDSRSLAYVVDMQSYNVAETDTSRIVTKSKGNYSMKYDNLYVADVDFSTTNDEQTDVKLPDATTTTIEHTIRERSFKRTNKYGTADCTIPTDLSAYVLIE